MKYYEVLYITNNSYPNVLTDRTPAIDANNAVLKIERAIQDASVISFESVNEIKKLRDTI